MKWKFESMYDAAGEGWMMPKYENGIRGEMGGENAYRKGFFVSGLRAVPDNVGNAARGVTGDMLVEVGAWGV